MITLPEILNMTALRQLIDDGYITARRHNEFPLEILNYSKMSQYDEKLVWGKEMNLCRGLIYNYQTLEVISRPFPKFWNLNDSRHPETMEENLPNETPIVLDKLDGSLGVLYTWDGMNYVATRGSFHSEQADWANNWLHKQHPGLQLPKNHTICAEVIFQKNTIVVNYDFEGLIVLGIINNETGTELSRSEVKDYCRAMGIPVVQEYRKSLSECIAENIPNREGYVLTYPSTGLKVKAKFEDYCKLHRILTNLNAHSIWEILRDGNDATLDEWMLTDKMPPEFKSWLQDTVSELRRQFNSIHLKAVEAFINRPTVQNRKDMAAYILQEEHKQYRDILFSMLDGKQYHISIWKKIEPVGGKVFKIVEE